MAQINTTLSQNSAALQNNLNAVNRNNNSAQLLGATGRTVGRFTSFFASKTEKRAAIDSFKNLLTEKYGETIANQASIKTLDTLYSKGRALSTRRAHMIMERANNLTTLAFNSKVISDLNSHLTSSSLMNSISNAVKEKYYGEELTPAQIDKVKSHVITAINSGQFGDKNTTKFDSEKIKELVSNLPSVGLMLAKDEKIGFALDNVLPQNLRGEKNTSTPLKHLDANTFDSLMTFSNQYGNKLDPYAFSSIMQFVSEGNKLAQTPDTCKQLWNSLLPDTPLPKEFAKDFKTPKNFLNALSSQLQQELNKYAGNNSQNIKTISDLFFSGIKLDKSLAFYAAGKATELRKNDIFYTPHFDSSLTFDEAFTLFTEKRNNLGEIGYLSFNSISADPDSKDEIKSNINQFCGSNLRQASALIMALTPDSTQHITEIAYEALGVLHSNDTIYPYNYEVTQNHDGNIHMTASFNRDNLNAWISYNIDKEGQSTITSMRMHPTA